MSDAEKAFTQQTQQAAQKQAQTSQKVLAEQAKHAKPKEVDVFKESAKVSALVKQVTALTEFVPDEAALLSGAVGTVDSFVSTITTQNAAEKAMQQFVTKVGQRCTQDMATQKSLPLGQNADLDKKTEFLQETEEELEKWLDGIKKE